MLVRICTALIALFVASAAYAEGALVHGTWPNGNPYLSWSTGHTSSQSAIQEAMSTCTSVGASGCSLVQAFNNTCIAVSQNTRGALSYAFNREKHEAHNQSLRNCAKGRRNCQIVNSACDEISEADLLFEQQEAEAERRVADEARRQRDQNVRPIEDVVKPVEQASPSIIADLPAPLTRFDFQEPFKNLTNNQKSMIGMFVIILLILFVFLMNDLTGRPSHTAPSSSENTPATPPLQQTPPPLPGQRNPEESRLALQLASHYLTELEPTMPKAMGDPSYKGSVLNALSLVSKQIAIAEANDPSVSLTNEHGELTLNVVKATALLYEAIARGSDKPHQAVPIIEKAISLVPLAPTTYHWLGDFHVILLNKQSAIEAYEKAVALDPKNIEYRASLDRARNMALSDIAINKAFRAGRTTVRTTKAVFYWGMLGFLLLACGTLIFNFGIGNFAFGILAIVGLFIGSKIHEFASR